MTESAAHYDSWDTFYLETLPLLRRCACGLTANWADMEDLVQETLCRAIHAHPDISTIELPLHYVLSALKKRSMKKSLMEVDLKEVSVNDPRQMVMPEVLDKLEREGFFRAIVDMCGPFNKDEKELLKGVCMGRTCEEMAGTCNQKVTRVKTRWEALTSKIRYRLRPRK